MAAEKPVGRSAKCYKFTYRYRPLGVVVTIRYTYLGAPGSIPFRTGEKDLKKGQKRRLFFFSRDRQIRPKPGRSQRPTPTGNSGGPRSILTYRANDVADSIEFHLEAKSPWTMTVLVAFVAALSTLSIPTTAFLASAPPGARLHELSSSIDYSPGTWSRQARWNMGFK